MKKVNSRLIEILSFNLKKIRLEKNLSQEELAEVSGLHRTYIGGIERGERNITLKTLECLAESLGVDDLYLISERAQRS